MSEKSLNLTRRKFMAVSSAAIATPVKGATFTTFFFRQD